MAWWRRKRAVTGEVKKSVPKGVWSKCPSCGEILVESDIVDNRSVCPACGYHHPLTARDRLASIIDKGSFVELGMGVEPEDPLGFKDSKRYRDRIKQAKKKSGESEAVIAGTATIGGRPVGVGVMVFAYMGGSMGSVVGERLTRMLEVSLERRHPAIICSASGGARMQEGILSLMQMAKVTAAISRLREAGQPYISVMHHPTTGGVAASFSMLGDVNIAEPGALIGFAGPRVIEQTIRQTLPEGFQRSEFLLEHGHVDMIVQREALRDRLDYLVRILTHR
ncbi:MAG: acetyl-CoA carboxylase carboxyltransferase subunit beta [Myxococcales bacterium]|nr:acetyl-CoA carboxylase carboxyltransferase subunit beta [Myxococcales bacterium]